MKKKVFWICLSLFIIFLIIAIVFFFLMKNADPGNLAEEQAEYDYSQIVEEIEFLKLSTYQKFTDYTKENPLFIRNSDNKLFFGVGELYIEGNSLNLYYTLNEDGSFKRIDGIYSYDLKKNPEQTVENLVWMFDCVVAEMFSVDAFQHNLYDETRMPLELSDASYQLLDQGKAMYALSIIDEHNTYWHVTAKLNEEKQVDFEFSRCFDLSIYNNVIPDIDLRTHGESEETLKSEEMVESEEVVQPTEKEEVVEE